MLRTEPKSKYDQGASAILELVDGPKDMRFAMTAAAVARDRALGHTHNELTVKNRTKVLRYRGEGGEKVFDDMVERIGKLDLAGVKREKTGGLRKIETRREHAEA